MTDRELLEKIQDKVISIEQVLKGYDGKDGLCKKVEDNSKSITKIWIALAVIVPASGGTSYAIMQKVIGG